MTVAAALALLRASTDARTKAASELKPGVYSLEGYNRYEDSLSGGKPYAGTVTITRSADLYKLGWRIGSAQSQVGVDILEGGVLSVGYFDTSGRDFGVVSYKVSGPGKLDGKWAPLWAKGYGREILVWRKPEDQGDGRKI